ncbi:MAG: response regulator [Candidatus Nanopelagicales bacterium]
MLLLLGPDLIQIHNGPASEAFGDQHPHALGRPARETLAPIWDIIGPLLSAALLDGSAALAERQLLTMKRRSFDEETFWTFWFNPLINPTGVVEGVLVLMQNVTDDVLHERRLRKLRKLGVLSANDCRDAHSAAGQALQILAGNRADLPLCVVVLAVPNDDSDDPPLAVIEDPGPHQATCLPSRWSDLTQAVIATADPLLLDATDWNPLPGEGRPGRGPTGVLIPLTKGSERPFGVLMVALSRHLVFDNEYLAFVRVVGLLVSRLIGDTHALQLEQEQRENLAQAEAARTALVHDVSHELRTPLTVITAALHELSGRRGHPEDLADLRAASYATTRLATMVDSLLAIAQGVGVGKAAAEPTDFRTLMDDLLAMFRPIIQGRGLSLRLDFEDGPAVVEIDREAWSKVIVNLLSNAVKFTAEGEVAVSLRFEKDMDGEQVAVLRVADTGAGIAAEEQELVFEWFRRGPTPSVHGEPGSGIGLAVVKEIVVAGGGVIELSSTLGVGSSFIVRMPAPLALGPSKRKIVDVAQLTPQHLTATPRVGALLSAAGAVTGKSASRGRVLVVEDDVTLRGYLERLIAADGYEVTTVADAESAMTMIDSQDLVLTDLLMPGMDGIALVTAIRATPSQLPVVLLTARSGTDSLVEGLRAGADDYLAKPFHPAELLARIRAHIELSQARRYALAEVEERAESLTAALHTNRRIGVAIGVITTVLKVSDERAFDLLRVASQHSNRKLREVAEEVILTGALPDQ